MNWLFIIFIIFYVIGLFGISVSVINSNMGAFHKAVVLLIIFSGSFNLPWQKFL